MYDQKISTNNPTLIVVLLDQSESMRQTMLLPDGHLWKLSDLVKLVTDKFLYQSLSFCQKELKITDRVEVAVIGYNSDLNSALPKVSMNNFPIGASILKSSYIKKNEHNDETYKFPRYEWVESISKNTTSMVLAFQKTQEIIDNWIPNHQQSSPPIILNVTDGMPTDEPDFNDYEKEFGGRNRLENLLTVKGMKIYQIAEQIKNSKTNYGNTLMANAHITTSSVNTGLKFPNDDSALDFSSFLLYHLSSEIPSELFANAREFGFNLQPGARFFLHNSVVDDFMNFFEFGSTMYFTDDNSKPALDNSDNENSSDEDEEKET